MVRHQLGRAAHAQVTQGPASVAGAAHAEAHFAGRAPRITSKAILQLMKPRVMSLVVFTALAGMFAAPGHIDPLAGLVAIIAIAAGAGASGALNMWYDADIDAVMMRTSKRGIPSGRISAEDTLSFGILLSVASIIVLTIATNFVAGGLLAFTIFYYVAIYTMWLKRSTPHNIVIGGAAGAFPPMIGWAAVTGSLSVESFVLFLIIFMWTPPHFWALALVKSEDYAAAGVPMLPNVKGPDATRLQILVYTVLMAPLGIVPTLMGFAGPVTFVVGTIGGLAMLWWAINVYRFREGKETVKASWQLFGGSIFYLFAIFAALLGERLFMLWWT
ncbi:MAG: heme o synthase [Beijerinckiaceae bacterium]|nr:heme o synthase [Beijerinckiaceae bacterium]